MQFFSLWGYIKDSSLYRFYHRISLSCEDESLLPSQISWRDAVGMGGNGLLAWLCVFTPLTQHDTQYQYTSTADWITKSRVIQDMLLNIYLLTNLLTPSSTVLLEKLTGLQLVKKFPAFYGTWRFITTVTSVRHLSLSCASLIQSILLHPTFWISILSSHLRLGLPSGLFP